MKQYLDLLEDVIENGIEKDDRTGTGVLSIFGRQLRFNLKDGFPLVTTKKLHLPSIIHELLWFISGDTNIRYLQKNGVKIWDEWADDEGNLGDVYGKQWRAWKKEDGKEIDQLSEVIRNIRTDPTSRRLLVSAWNVGEVENMSLPPCHYAYQFYVAGGILSCMFNMRSVDLFLGLPFNIASYALLTQMVAQQCELDVGELIWNGGDVHLYQNHFDQAKMQLQRLPYPLPKIAFKRKPDSIFDYCYEDFEIIDYKSHPSIKAPIAI